RETEDWLGDQAGSGTWKDRGNHPSPFVPNDVKVVMAAAGADVAQDGSMNDKAGKYVSMDRFDARKQLWADMEADDLVIKKENYKNRVPRSQRGGEVVEPMVSAQWFIKMKPLAEPALAAVDSGDLKIVPDRFEKIYRYWLEGIKDWCISRQLWWGHRIPVWYVHKDAAAAEMAQAGGGDGSSEVYVVAHSEEDAKAKAVAEHGDGVVLVQDADVLDTWFSSGLWPFSTLGWPEQTPKLEKFYPTAVMETGHDILFFWVARMVMMGLELTGKLPFHTIFLHGLVRDAQGRKMSKTLGNVTDPLDLIGEMGTDPLRFTLAVGNTPGQDLNLSNERLNSNRNFINKIWNVGKFILYNLQEASAEEKEALSKVDLGSEEAVKKLPLAERWIVSKLHALIEHVTACQERYDFGEAGRAMYEFLWSEFADWYVESSKSKLYSKDLDLKNNTLSVLVYVYEKTLRLLHPFIPFVTEDLWQAIPHSGTSVSTASWPACGLAQDKEAVENFEVLQDLVRSIRNVRAEYNVEMGKKIPVTIAAATPAVRSALDEELDAVAGLARLDTANLQIVQSLEDTEVDGVRAVVCEGLEVFLPLAGLADPAKEIARLEKQKKKIEKELQQLNGRLSSPKFVEKAPQKVVDEAKAQAAGLQEELNLVDQRLEQMNKLLAAA
ncbi:hypothetical protein CYMTET_23464, partial [Cymbomonas tetramitiformis]